MEETETAGEQERPKDEEVAETRKRMGDLGMEGEAVAQLNRIRPLAHLGALRRGGAFVADGTRNWSTFFHRLSENSQENVRGI